MNMGELAYGKDAPVSGTGISAAAPLAGTAVATISGASLMFTPGTWDIVVFTRLHATSPTDEVAGLERNMEFRVGATVVKNGLISTKAPGGVYYFTDIQLNGSTNVSVNVSANASAGVFYSATIVAVRTS